jgi:hypothetical protein
MNLFGNNLFGNNTYSPNLFRGRVEAVVLAGSTGGNYGVKKFRYLPPLEVYEERLKKVIAEQEREKQQELEEMRAKFLKIEQELAKKAKKERITLEVTKELELLIVKDMITEIEAELRRLMQMLANIEHWAMILRDDEELLLLMGSL